MSSLICLSSYFFFFFLMIRRPPRSTLFPTRRSSDLAQVEHRFEGELLHVPRREVEKHGVRVRPVFADDRSEEHTSELQSHVNLVCRLLLEKKKKKNTRT